MDMNQSYSSTVMEEAVTIVRNMFPDITIDYKPVGTGQALSHEVWVNGRKLRMKFSVSAATALNVIHGLDVAQEFVTILVEEIRHELNITEKKEN